MTNGLSGALGVSPLHDYWAARMLTNSWGAAGNLTLPGEISNAQDEMAAFGGASAFADISSRTVTSVTGAEAAAFLCAISGDAEAAFEPERIRTILWSGADGFVRGAGRVVMRSAGQAILVSEVSDQAWLRTAAEPFDVRLETAPAAGLRLAGPLTKDILRGSAAAPGPACTMEFPGLGPVMAIQSKTGAIDLWVEPDNAHALAWTLERAGARPAGSKALNAWRIAHGLLSAERDWLPAQAGVASAAMRTREDLTGGAYVLAAWNAQPPIEVAEAVAWPPLGQWFAILHQPPKPGRTPEAPRGAAILGPAATD